MSFSRIFTVVLMYSIFGGPYIAPSAEAAPADQVISIPELALWESNMIRFGRKHGEYLLSLTGTLDERLAATYYDAEYVFLRIGAYTKDPAWDAYAKAAQGVYLDQYAIPNKGQVPGYWNFTHGLLEWYRRTGDQKAKGGVILISQNAAYTPDFTPLEWTMDVSRSREVAYAIMGFLNAEAVGTSRRSKLSAFITQALGHLKRWSEAETFMIGLTCRALIQYDQAIGDHRIQPAITAALDDLWNRAWLPPAKAFRYMVSNGSGPTADLNLLIAPAFAWMYLKTGDVIYRNRGDQIFAGGVKGTYLDAPKQFNQNYTWSFDYVAWRAAADSQGTQSLPSNPK